MAEYKSKNYISLFLIVSMEWFSCFANKFQSHELFEYSPPSDAIA